ncbi:MAG: M20/M25/M40 family metallo-hydrolase [Gammaproteobacteria bacterium]|nr:M20/M25/M40 family metallo-hydrolase [Gammaproteobacteria bacterium]
MLRIPSAAFLICLACLALPVFAQDPGPAPGSVPEPDLIKQAVSLRDGAMADSGAYSILESLTQEIGPRLAGSPGDQAAVAWAMVKMNELGFDSVYAQDVVVPHWERGQLKVEITGPNPQILVATALGGSVGTGEEGIEAPILMVQSLDELAALPRAQVEGTIVFLPGRMQRAKDGSGYGPAVKKRSSGASIAASLGARALIIRSVGTDNNRLGHTGAMRYDPAHPRIPAVALSNPDADILEYQLGNGQPVSVRLTLSARYLEPTRSANLIGEILGSEHPEQIVLIGGHLDSWDLGTGAIDDGAGVAISLEVARQIMALGQPPRRTIRVVLFANEEFGLSGAKEYGRLADVENHIVGMEADFGAGRVWRLSSRVAPEAMGKVHALQAMLADLDIEPGNNESGGGADLSPLSKTGIPVLSPEQDGTLYFDIHHTANDTLDKVNKDDLDQNVGVYAALTWVVANMDGDFGRLPVEQDEATIPESKQ